MGTVEQDTARYMAAQDKLQAEEARFESLCEEWEGKLERQEPEAVESYVDFLYDCSHSGKHNGGYWMEMEALWAEEQSEKQMARERTQANDY